MNENFFLFFYCFALIGLALVITATLHLINAFAKNIQAKTILMLQDVTPDTLKRFKF